MDNLARELQNQAASLVYGTVLAHGDAAYSVACDQGPLTCERADGCLLKPQPGDLVLVATTSDTAGYILSIIKRAQSGKRPAVLDVQGDLNISTADGDLTLASNRNLSLFAGSEASIVSEKLSAGAIRAQLQAHKVSVATRLFTGSYSVVSMAAESVEHVFSSLTQKLRNCVRMVEEHDEVTASSARLAVQDDYAVQSRNEVHLAEEVVKIDAEEVHLG